MDVGLKYFRILSVSILLGWLIFLAIAIYHLWVNSPFLGLSGGEGDSLRKLALALCWGAAGAWVRAVQVFMTYLRDVDENGIDRSHWVYLFTHPLFYPLFGGVVAAAIVFLLLGTGVDEIRIAGISIITGFLFYELERRLQLMMPED
jgi:hypothetical protein